MRLITVFCSFVGFLMLGSCKKIDRTYADFVQPGGRTYTAKPTGLIMSGGLNRINIKWPRGVDPSVVKAKIFWNVKADSVEIPVTPTLDTVSYTIDNLEEGNYSFTVITYDALGNSSVPIEVFGSSYGPRYEAKLLSRPALSATQMRNGDLVVTWGEADTALGAFATEIKYVNRAGDSTIKRIGVLADSTRVNDYQAQTSVWYRTLFLPTANALDTFYTPYVEEQVMEYVPPRSIDLSSRFLKNFKAPFERATYDGARWGTLSHWITNGAMQNQGPAGNKVYGGYDNINNSGSFGLQKWGAGDPAVVNGKAYQTVTLPAGDYEVIWTTEGNSSAVNRGNGERYLVVAAGNSLPDVAGLEAALARVSFVTGVDRFNVKVAFSLEQTTEVSLGILVNFIDGQQAVRAGAMYLWGPDPEG